jgi:sugar lactone lactonase YvrE
LTIPRYVAKRFFEPPSEELRFLPEGPRLLQNYPGGGARVGWVSIQHSVSARDGSINVLDLESGENRNVPLPGRPGFFAETTQPGVVLVGLERRLVYCELLTGEVEEMGITVSDDERVIINDGLPVDTGLLFGTKHLEFKQPIAGLYFFEYGTRLVHTVLDRQICSNGKSLRRDEDGATLIDIDSRPKEISRYRLDTKLERVLERSLIVAPDSLPGFPDGLRPSPDGDSVIVAFFNPEPVADGLARQFRLADGAVLCEWLIPGSPRVTCPEFVRIDGKVKLLFTTAVEGMPEAARKLAPGAGALYIADTPFDSMPAAPPLAAR